MQKKLFILFISVLGLFFMTSCHHTMRKACCGKSHHQGMKKACCAKKSKHKGMKKACCGKRSKFWKMKKSCCGKGSVVGQANVKAVKGYRGSGTVLFEQVGRHKVKVTANFTGLKPNHLFGFHVHEFGTCENKALMAGGHLNPWKQKHGGPQDKKRHLGDLGNLKSSTKGQAAYSTVIKGKVKKFLGRSVIVHAQADDLKSQPSGNSGDRIACGVIVAAMPPAPEETKK